MTNEQKVQKILAEIANGKVKYPITNIRLKMDIGNNVVNEVLRKDLDRLEQLLQCKIQGAIGQCDIEIII